MISTVLPSSATYNRLSRSLSTPRSTPVRRTTAALAPRVNGTAARHPPAVPHGAHPRGTSHMTGPPLRGLRACSVRSTRARPRGVWRSPPPGPARAALSGSEPDWPAGDGEPTHQLPCLSFRSSEVFLPGSQKVLHLFEAQALQALDEALQRTGGLIACLTVAAGGDGTVAVERAATLARVESVQDKTLGARVKLIGETRIKLYGIPETEPHIRGTFSEMTSAEQHSTPYKEDLALYGEQVDKLKAIITDLIELRRKMDKANGDEGSEGDHGIVLINEDGDVFGEDLDDDDEDIHWIDMEDIDEDMLDRGDLNELTELLSQSLSTREQMNNILEDLDDDDDDGEGDDDDDDDDDDVFDAFGHLEVSNLQASLAWVEQPEVRLAMLPREGALTREAAQEAWAAAAAAHVPDPLSRPFAERMSFAVLHVASAHALSAEEVGQLLQLRAQAMALDCSLEERLELGIQILDKQRSILCAKLALQQAGAPDSAITEEGQQGLDDRLDLDDELFKDK